MTYDLFDYFLKQRNNKIFTETNEVVRQTFWRESFDVVTSQTWIGAEDKIRFDWYWELLWC